MYLANIYSGDWVGKSYEKTNKKNLTELHLRWQNAYKKSHRNKTCD